MEEINYEDMVSFLHMSSYDLYRTFSFLTGMTVNTYIRNRRSSLVGIEILRQPLILHILL
jgi:AraC family transcriptional regulator